MASPELTMLISMIRARPLTGQATLAETRSGFEKMSSMFPVPPGVGIERSTLNGVTVERLAPAGAAADRAVVYLHGGAYVIGSIQSHRSLAARIGQAAGSVAFAVEYRLAPEHPYPAAIEDAVAVYRGLLAQGFAPEKLSIAGDSAGGGLTMATLLALKEEGLPMPGAAVTLSPWVDLEGSGESMIERSALDPIVQKAELQAMAKLYLQDVDPRSPKASPIHADLSGLPPLLIHVGTAETLYDDSVRLHARAVADGVDATLEPWDDMIHVWHLFSMLPESHSAVTRVGEFLRKHTGG